MPSKECDQHIPGFPPEDVFVAGIQTKTLPRHVGGFVMRTDAASVRRGTAFDVGLSITKLKPIRLSAKVVEFEPHSHVLIRGRERGLASAEVWLDLAEEQQIDGTSINYGIDIQLSGLTKLAAPLVQAELDSTLPLFAAQYVANVTDLLQVRSCLTNSVAAA